MTKPYEDDPWARESGEFGGDERANSPSDESLPDTGSSWKTAPSRTDVRMEMEVIGLDGVPIGQVKDLREYDFLVDRPNHRDIYVPYEAVDAAIADQLRLNVSSDRIDDQGWQKPHITGGNL